MDGITMARVEESIADLARPSYENLCKHVDRFGLDNAASTKHADRYTTYKKFSKDSATVTARAYLSEAAFVMFVERYGERGWTDAARSDWQAVREDA